METNELPLSNELPYLVFKANGISYALNCGNISSILQYEGCNPIPKSPPEVKGVMVFRNLAVPVIDLRVLFDQPSMEDEYQEFCEMLDQRQQDHIHWVDELEHSLAHGEAFKLATDPHKCAFGRWYDHYHNDLHSVMFHLSKIKEPHEKLHHAATEAAMCKQACATCERQECLKDILQRVKEQYMPEVLRLLDDAKGVFHATYKEMIIVMGEDRPVGIMVDEVLSVEELREEGTLDSMGHSRSELIVGLMRNDRDSHLIFLLDGENILHRYEDTEQLKASSSDQMKLLAQ